MDPAWPIPPSPVVVTSNAIYLDSQTSSTSRVLAPAPLIPPTLNGNASDFNSKKAEKRSQRYEFKKMQIKRINRKLLALASQKRKLLTKRRKLMGGLRQKKKVSTPATVVTPVTAVKSDSVNMASATMALAAQDAVSPTVIGSKSIPSSEGAVLREGVHTNDFGSSRNVSTQCEESAVMCSCAHTSPKKIKLDDPASNWLSAVADYVRETGTSFLDLGGKGLEIKEVQAALSLLPGSKVTELNLEGNCLERKVEKLLPFLTKSKIRGLNVSRCRLTKRDIKKLLKALKDLQIIELDVEGNSKSKFDEGEAEKCISHLKNSKLMTLILNFYSFSHEPIASLQGFLETSITCLNLKSCGLGSNEIIFLFTNLGHSSITDLSIEDNHISSETLQALREKLVETKLERLNLDGIGLKDDKLEILVEGLFGSNIINFGLPNNKCSSFTPLFAGLKKTKIRALSLCNSFRPGGKKSLVVSRCLNFARLSSLTSLDLSNCRLQDKNGERLMEALRLSKVVELDISHNNLGPLTIGKLADNIKDIKLKDLNISHNSLSGDRISILGGCLKNSELTCLDISSSEMQLNLFQVLKLIEGSSVSRIKMEHSLFLNLHDYDSKFLASLPLQEVHLPYCNLKSDVLDLIKELKFTSVTHLNLCSNKITDDLAVAAAEHLRETQIRRLDLTYNRISNLGAKALAHLFKNSSLLYLNLRLNYIEDSGLRYLAQMAKETFVTELEVYHDAYDQHRDQYREPLLLIDEVLWRNKLSALRLITFFKHIAPQTNDNEFCFSQNFGDLDVSAFLHKCLSFCKTVLNNPIAVNVLLEEESITFSREEILSLFSVKFPRQFSQFIAHQIEADVTEHVMVLKLAEEMKLTAVVEELLCNRGAYVLDEKQEILHPFVYSLLYKYKQPICSFAVEPSAKIKIIKYFTLNADIEGSQDVIDLLNNSKGFARQEVDCIAGPSGM